MDNQPTPPPVPVTAYLQENGVRKPEWYRSNLTGFVAGVAVTVAMSLFKGLVAYGHKQAEDLHLEQRVTTSEAMIKHMDENGAIWTQRVLAEEKKANEDLIVRVTKLEEKTIPKMEDELRVVQDHIRDEITINSMKNRK